MPRIRHLDIKPACTCDLNFFGSLENLAAPRSLPPFHPCSVSRKRLPRVQCHQQSDWHHVRCRVYVVVGIGGSYGDAFILYIWVFIHNTSYSKVTFGQYPSWSRKIIWDYGLWICTPTWISLNHASVIPPLQRLHLLVGRFHAQRWLLPRRGAATGGAHCQDWGFRRRKTFGWWWSVSA